LHLHDAFDALLARSADVAVVPLISAAIGGGVAADVTRALASLSVDATDVAAALGASGTAA
jgi:hypothetical protein